MSYEPEIKDTPEDRAAMAILLPFSSGDLGRPWNEVDASLMDAAWLTLARELASAEEARIDDILSGIEEARSEVGGSNLKKLGVERAASLMLLIVDWRHRRWIDKELHEGRDPYRLAVP